MTAETPSSGSDDLQFDSAEAASASPAGTVCAVCQKPITTYYWEAGGQIVCTSCKNKIAASNVSGVAAAGFLRAGLFGLVGAALGAGVYYAVLATTGYEVGLIAILLGFMAGYGVRMGAGGRGGRRYQFLAVVLTYLAIGSTYIPIAIREMSKDDETQADSTLAGAAQRDTTAAAGAPGRLQRAAADSSSMSAPVALLIGLAALVAFAAILPVLVVIGGFPSTLISLLIYGFALHQAWRMNGGVNIAFSGPFKVGAAPAGGAAGA